MQFCQPTSFQPQPPGFYNYGQPSGCNAPNMPFPSGYPEIIGEGNVVSFISTDGNTQLVFFPTIQWSHWRTPHQNNYVGNLNNPYVNHLGAWFVRNIGNPPQSTVFPQTSQENYGTPFARGSTSEFCITLPQAGCQLKFHNDTCTSTTDINYFIPKQWSWFRCLTGNAAVQVEPPEVVNASCNYEAYGPPNPETACTKPCNCTLEPSCKQHTTESMCCDQSNNSVSRMSIDSRPERKRKEMRHKSKESHKCECREWYDSDEYMSQYGDHRSRSADIPNDSTKLKQKRYQKRPPNTKKSHYCDCHNSVGCTSSHETCFNTTHSGMSIDSTRSTHNQHKSKSHSKTKTKKSCHECECREQSTSYKTTTTYADKGIACAPHRELEAQTSPACINTIPIIKVTKESGQKPGSPKPSTSKEAKKSKKLIKKSPSFDSNDYSRRITISDSGSCSCTTESEVGYY